MGKILVFIFDGMTDYQITFITHLLVADAGKEAKDCNGKVDSHL